MSTEHTQARRDSYWEAVSAGDIDRIHEALVDVAFTDSDWRWVQARCLECLEHPSWTVRAIAATCIGHIARIHRAIDLELVKSSLARAAEDPRVADYVTGALDDIVQFVAAPPS